MSKEQQKRRNQAKTARLEIVADLHKKGYSYRSIQSEVMKRLDLKTYSLRTVHNDIQSLLAEWREYRLDNTDHLVQLELARIDDTIRELWAQWEKSKTDYTKKSNKRQGKPNGKPQKGEDGKEVIPMNSTFAETTTTEVIALGDVSYISEIRHQLAERRKLLGLYAPDKKEVSGDLSFSALLMESGIIDDGAAAGDTKK